MNGVSMVKEFKVRKKLMGCEFELMVAEDDEVLAEEALQKGIEEIQRIEELLSEYKFSSQTSLINANAARQPVKVDPEVYQLILRCKEISRLTQGAFDITMGPLKKLYHFKNDDAALPSPENISDALKTIGHRHLQLLENNSVSFGKEGMQISFAAVGKGYAADCVIRLWKEMEIRSGVVNASGDLTFWGKRADDSNWKVGIAHPDNKNEIVLWISIEESAVATSGDYEQFFIHDGIRYSHNINPVTGYPLTGIKSVTVVSRSAELCDALCTAVYVMGVEVGLHFINQLPRTHCLIIDEKNEFYHSKNLEVIYA
ncbi:MAG TPA: FAD:protein FMN transferase [Chitinophagales bacterium]|nr:FAD:protein FMN transferase [Chitinophagales bacterium]